jgi:hypothetical protein
MTSFKHSGHLGDLIASMPTIREYNRKTGKEVVLYLGRNVVALFPEGVTHPTKNGDTMVMLNDEMIKMITPLLECQPYIKEVRVHNGEDIDIDLDVIRVHPHNQPFGCLERWYFYHYPDLACDLSEQWLTVPDSERNIAKGKIIVTRTERYTNPYIDYSFLKEFEDDLLFSGTMREYNNFCMNFDLNIRKLNIDNFLELAQAMRQAKFHLSNQTMAFQISTGLKIPRVVELCAHAPNVIPYGKEAYDFYNQDHLEYYFFKLNGMEDEMIKRYTEKAKTSPSKVIGEAL